MRIITRKRLREFAQRHPDATEALDNWYRFFREAQSRSLQDVRRVYPHADPAYLPALCDLVEEDVEALTCRATC